MMRSNDHGVVENAPYPINIYFSIVELPNGNYAFLRKLN